MIGKLFYYTGGINEFEVFTRYFNKLVNILPVKSITHNLISSRIITIDDDEEIKSIARSKDKASLVLRKVGRSLEVGVTQSFYELLMIMKQHRGDSAILAAEIQNELVKCNSHIPGENGTKLVKCFYADILHSV